ncbi:MAG TPA: MBOAT family protein [Candidatus Thermoplasmatota archaeon]|nr:MBOAT family protein [Candidatus Thermoplasmatota archaeon]
MDCQALFNTRCFLFGFLPVVLAGYWLMPGRTWKLAWLTAASFLFYSFWDLRFVLLLVAAAAVDFTIALGLERSVRHRKAWLVSSIAFNLGVLAVFKYAIFAAANARSILSFFDVPVAIPLFSVVLPVGISFFTFKTMSYTVDVYRREVPACRDPLKFLAFVSLFPELVAGPIVRYQNISHQIDHLPQRPRWHFFGVGVTLLVIGLAKKVLVADTVASYIDPLWADAGHLTLGSAWTAALGYTLQLYFDFSGYSDMAIGIAAMLGLRFPINFRAPYQALDPSDFWRRWHITLSTFLRDYLYIPLGGNRRGKLRTELNLVIVMALGGLWHGASWTFVLWGLYHGWLLMVHRMLKDPWARMPKAAQRLLTLFLVVLGWVLFRAPTIHVAGQVYAAMFHVGAWGTLAAPLLLACVAVLACTMVLRPSVELRMRPLWMRAGVAAAAFALSVALLERESPFLYYQF